ncbi:MAG: RDD family protein [Allosphingosinicella sp.]
MADYAIAQQIADSRKRRSLVTPEGVDLSLKLADAGQRIAAFLIDLAIMTGTLLVFTLLCLAGAFAVGMASGEILLVLWLLGFFFLRSCYFILMELSSRAATFGKRSVGIRVVARSGERLTADRVIARNLMREIEFYLPLSFLSYNAAEGASQGWTALAGLLWTAIFLLFPLFNRDRLRIGDLLAGTWVVSAPRRKLGIDRLQGAAAERAHRFTDAQLDVYGVFELQTLEQVLRLDHPQAIARVAETIRTKIGYSQDPFFDRDFLIDYYDAARTRMERGLLFGIRRAHKNDR